MHAISKCERDWSEFLPSFDMVSHVMRRCCSVDRGGGLTPKETLEDVLRVLAALLLCTEVGRTVCSIHRFMVGDKKVGKAQLTPRPGFW